MALTLYGIHCHKMFLNSYILRAKSSNWSELKYILENLKLGTFRLGDVAWKKEAIAIIKFAITLEERKAHFILEGKLI